MGCDESVSVGNDASDVASRRGAQQEAPATSGADASQVRCQPPGASRRRRAGQSELTSRAVALFGIKAALPLGHLNCEAQLQRANASAPGGQKESESESRGAASASGRWCWFCQREFREQGGAKCGQAMEPGSRR